MRFRIGMCVALLAFSSPVWAQRQVYVYSGFMKGESYLGLSEANRAAYAMGLLDGLFGAGFYGADASDLKKLQQCTSGMTNTQLRAVLDQHVRANPINWQHPMNVLAFNAFIAACPSLRPEPN